MDHYPVEGYQDVGSWFRYAKAYEELVRRMPIDRPSIIVEVGCWKGASTAYLGVEVINSGKPITIVVIDTFAGSKSEPTMVQVAAEQDVLSVFQRNVLPVREVLGDRFQLHCKDSLTAAVLWEMEQPDAVWIDADHSYVAAKADIQAWWVLVRKGGVLGGDDYDSPGVRQALDEFAYDLGGLIMPSGITWWWIEKP